jgi:hypothetical protein
MSQTRHHFATSSARTDEGVPPKVLLSPTTAVLVRSRMRELTATFADLLRARVVGVAFGVPGTPRADADRRRGHISAPPPNDARSLTRDGSHCFHVCHFQSCDLSICYPSRGHALSVTGGAHCAKEVLYHLAVASRVSMRRKF